MKKSIYIVMSLLLVTMGSCKKYLDQVPDDVITVDDIFTSRANTEKFLANVYNPLPDELAQRYTGTFNSGTWTASSDEAQYNWDFNYSNKMNKSTWKNDDGEVAYLWNNYYVAIRNATYFIKNIDGANSAEVSAALKKTYKAEARGLRALYYYFLLRTYGAVPIIGDNLLDLNSDIESLSLPRTPFDQGIDFVVSEMDAAYADLPYTPNLAQYGRMTKGACKAYKVEALLLKASPLYNGNTAFAGLTNKDGTKLYSQSYSVAKWADAAAAGKAFLDEFDPGYYSLYKETDADPFLAAYKSTKNVVLKDWNSEWIFGRSISSSYLQYDLTPKHVGAQSSDQQGGGALGATQKIVDAYFMANGRSIDDAQSGYSATGFSSFKAPFDVAARTTYNQWTNREPRFYVGITYNNSYWLNQINGNTLITDMTFSGNSGRTQSTSDVSPTGYIIRKNVGTNGNSRGSIYLRLANIYLDYAEALNESQPGNADIVKYVNLIRDRAGVPQYGAGTNPLPIPGTQADMQTAIRKERQVELAFENVRYFDTRRWKIAETTDAGSVYGMDMTKNGNDFYNKTLIETRVFQARDYLYPIPNGDVLRNNNMVQNPGW